MSTVKGRRYSPLVGSATTVIRSVGVALLELCSWPFGHWWTHRRYLKPKVPRHNRRCEAGFAQDVPTPEPANLNSSYLHRGGASRCRPGWPQIELGKALFWDQAVGSDGPRRQSSPDRAACGSCHFNGGADSRTFTQLNPASAPYRRTTPSRRRSV